MTLTQRHAGVLRRHAAEWDKQGLAIQAACMREAARRLEEMQRDKEAAMNPWQPMRTAPKTGEVVLALLPGSDIPCAVRWLEPWSAPHVFSAGWHTSWDGYRLGASEEPRYWMRCPGDPDA